MAASILQKQRSITAMETLLPIKLKIFIIWTFTEKVCQDLQNYGKFTFFDRDKLQTYPYPGKTHA